MSCWMYSIMSGRYLSAEVITSADTNNDTLYTESRILPKIHSLGAANVRDGSPCQKGLSLLAAFGRASQQASDLAGKSDGAGDHDVFSRSGYGVERVRNCCMHGNEIFLRPPLPLELFGHERSKLRCR